MEALLCLIVFAGFVAFLHFTFGRNRIWGQSFVRDLIFSGALLKTSFSRESALKETTARRSKLGPRVTQLWLALNPLASMPIFVFLFIILSVIPEGPAGALSFFTRYMANLTQAETPPIWLYWFAENSWTAIFCGLAVGAVVRLICRHTGLSWVVAGILLFAGTASLAMIFGIFLGDFFEGRVESLIRYKDKDFRLQNGLSLAFGLVMLLFAPYYTSSIMSWLNGEYSVNLRWAQLAVMIILFILMELIVLAGFFHFYHARSQKLTKV